MRSLLVLALLAGVAHADTVRVASVDVDRVLAESRVGKEAGKKLDRVRAKRQQELDLAAARLKKASEQCNARPDPGCKDAVTKQMQTLQQQYTALESEVSALATKLAAEAMKTIDPAIERVARNAKVELVIVAQPLYAGSAPVDITAELIRASDDSHVTPDVSPTALTVARIKHPLDKATRDHVADAARDQHIDVLVEPDDILFTSVELRELQPK